MIRVRQIKGDIIELFFNPKEKEEALRVGENLLVREREGERGLIVQVVGLETVSYPALIREQLELAAEGGGLPPAALFEVVSPQNQELARGNLLVAAAKIRKVVLGDTWQHWDGWIPTRDVVVERVNDEQVASFCFRDYGHLLRLGKMAGGAGMLIEGRDLEKVSIITGVKGAGKSHLAKAILLKLIRLGAPVIVFDLNREYIHLPRYNVNPATGKGQRGVLVLSAGGNLKLDIRHWTLAKIEGFGGKSKVFWQHKIRSRQKASRGEAL